MGLGRTAANMDAATEADVRSVMRAGLRRFYFPVVDGEYTYQWRWLEKNASLPIVDPYETGTITVAAGVITLVGGTWPSWILDAFILVGGHVLFVSSLGAPPTTVANTPNTQLAVSAGTTFTAYRYRYELPSDFAEWIGGVVYANGSDSWMLTEADESEIRLRYAIGQGANSRTTHYDVTSTPDADGHYIMLWPVPAHDAFIQGTYLSTPADNLPADLTVPGSTIQVAPAYAQCVLEAILAEAESFYNSTAGLHEAKFQAALKVAIAHDKTMGGHYDFSYNSLSRHPYGYGNVLAIDWTDAQS